MKICFFAKVADPNVLRRVGFYKQDLDILHELGHEVMIATKWSEIPWNADLYYVWWWTWAFLPLLKAKVYRKPVLITGVFDYRWGFGSGDYFHRPFWQRFLLRFSLRHANANVFVSQNEFDQITGDLYAQSPYYSPLIVDTEKHTFKNGSRDPFVFTLSSLQGVNMHRKCLPQILESIPAVLRQFPNIRFVFAGEKTAVFPHLQSIVKRLGIEDAVEFAGILPLEKKIDLMHRCLVYLQPSLYEGFGLAILEAMSCGAAVVSSPVGAVPEVVGDSGLLVNGASSGAIAEGVLKFLKDSSLREEMGRKAHQRVLKLFSFSRRREDLNRIINEVAG